MNGYADDLGAVIEALDLKDATLVGHSTGGGEVARYIGRHVICDLGNTFFGKKSSEQNICFWQIELAHPHVRELRPNLETSTFLVI